MRDLSAYRDFHLEKAPIIQAILEIRIKTKTGVSIQSLERMQDEIKEDFPIKNKRYKGIIRFTEPERENIQGSTQQDGYVLKSNDNLRTIMAVVDQFDYMQATAYNRWEEFIGEAKQLWEKYKTTITSTFEIKRLSVRYINKIDIELPIADIAEYFKTYPVISPDMPQSLEHYYLRCTIPLKDENVRVHVVHTIGETENNKCPFFFDIDVLWTPPEKIEEKKIWEQFDRLRLIKNQTFRESLTPKTLSMLK